LLIRWPAGVLFAMLFGKPAVIVVVDAVATVYYELAWGVRPRQK
jgi:hypothetical protein